MEFRGLTKRSFRKKLERREFYTDIFFERDKDKEKITEWAFRLFNIKGIEINKFKDLLCDWDEIVFPIKIWKCKSKDLVWIPEDELQLGEMQIIFVDAQRKEFYMNISNDATNINQYSLGIKENIDRYLVYEISPKGKLVFQTCYAIVEKYTEHICSECKEYSIHYEKDEVVMQMTEKIENREIIVRYDSQKDERSQKIINMLSGVNANNVLSLVMELEDKDDIYVQSKVNGKVHSEIFINDGIVREYSYTEYLIYKEEYCTHRISQPLDLQEFISKYRYSI